MLEGLSASTPATLLRADWRKLESTLVVTDPTAVEEEEQLQLLLQMLTFI